MHCCKTLLYVVKRGTDFWKAVFCVILSHHFFFWNIGVLIFDMVSRFVKCHVLWKNVFALLIYLNAGVLWPLEMSFEEYCVLIFRATIQVTTQKECVSESWESFNTHKAASLTSTKHLITQMVRIKHHSKLIRWKQLKIRMYFLY